MYHGLLGCKALGPVAPSRHPGEVDLLGSQIFYIWDAWFVDEGLVGVSCVRALVRACVSVGVLGMCVCGCVRV